MPRPKNDENSITELEIRITPPDQQRIVQWELDEFITLVVAEEGEPNGTLRLHYHGYLKTSRSKSWIRDWIYRITKTEHGQLNGNALYFSRRPHEYTYGYIVKSGNVVVRHGISQTTLDEWLTDSKEYCKQKESRRKQQQRTRAVELNDIFDEIEKELKEGKCYRSIDTVVDRTLSLCYHKQVRFPARTQMEQFVLKAMYSYDMSMVRSYYTRTFETR